MQDQAGQADIWLGDTLGRRAVADQLTRLMRNSRGPLVVSITAPFGMGKTFLAQRWVLDLVRQGEIAVYFNAWKTDFAGEPVIAFVDALKDSLSKFSIQEDVRGKAAEQIKKISRAAAPAIARTALTTALKVGVKVLTGSSVDTLMDAAVAEVASEAENLAKAQIDAFSREKRGREAIGDELIALRNVLVGPDDDKSIYIIVDELDRCRPIYSIEFLEDIKHLLGVAGFVFIVFCNMSQLRSSAAHLYGAAVEGEDYLARFIDIQLSLPPPSQAAFAQGTARDTIGRTKVEERPAETFERVFGAVAGSAGLSLRQIKRAARQLEIVALSDPAPFGRIGPALAMGLILAQKDSEAYDKLRRGVLGYSELVRTLGQPLSVDDFLASWGLVLTGEVPPPNVNEDSLSEVQKRAVGIYNSLDASFLFSSSRSVGRLVVNRLEQMDEFRR